MPDPARPGAGAAAVLDEPAGPVPAAAHGAGASLALVRGLLTLTRPGQWPKNLLVVPLALLAAAQWTGREFLRAGWAVLVFTLLSAAMYAANDVADRHRDAAHPRKRTRPVASGLVPPAVALGLAAVLVLAEIPLLALVPAGQWWPVPVYLATTTAYSAGLKNVPLLDVFLVAAGFLLRVAEGYLATGVRLSPWLPISVFCFCLLLALGKRRHELATHGAEYRPVLRGYSIPLIDQLLALSGVLAATCFVLFLSALFTAPSAAGRVGPIVVVAAVPLMLLGLFRYFQVLTVHQGGGDPTRLLLRDALLLADGIALGLLLTVALVGSHHTGAASAFAPPALLLKAV